MRAVIIATDEFEDRELTYPYSRLQEAGYDVDIAVPARDRQYWFENSTSEPLDLSDEEPREITGKHEHVFKGDVFIEELDVDDYDVAIVPGGASPELLRTYAPASAEFLQEFDAAGKTIGSICHGPQLLISANVVEGRPVTAVWRVGPDLENAGAEFVDEAVVVDDNLVTSRVPKDLPDLMREVIKVADA